MDLIPGPIRNGVALVGGRRYRPSTGDPCNLNGRTMLFGLYYEPVTAKTEDIPAQMNRMPMVWMWGTPRMQEEKWADRWSPGDLALLRDDDGVRLGFWREL